MCKFSLVLHSSEPLRIISLVIAWSVCPPRSCVFDLLIILNELFTTTVDFHFLLVNLWTSPNFNTLHSLDFQVDDFLMCENKLHRIKLGYLFICISICRYHEKIILYYTRSMAKNNCITFWTTATNWTVF